MPLTMHPTPDLFRMALSWLQLQHMHELNCTLLLKQVISPGSSTQKKQHHLKQCLIIELWWRGRPPDSCALYVFSYEGTCRLNMPIDITKVKMRYVMRSPTTFFFIRKGKLNRTNHPFSAGQHILFFRLDYWLFLMVQFCFALLFYVQNVGSLLYIKHLGEIASAAMFSLFLSNFLLIHNLNIILALGD